MLVDAFYFQRLLLERAGTLFIEAAPSFIEDYLQDMAVNFLARGDGCVVTGFRKASYYKRLTENVIKVLKESHGYVPALDHLSHFACEHINTVRAPNEKGVSLLIETPGEVYMHARGYMDKLLDACTGSRIYIENRDAPHPFPLKPVLLQHHAYLYKDPVI